MTSHAVSDEALDIIFRHARTQNKWQDKPVSHAHLMALYDLMRWGPTSANISPARIVFLASQAAKERLKPHLAPRNQEKTMARPPSPSSAWIWILPRSCPSSFPTIPR